MFDPRADTELLIAAAEAAGDLARHHFRTDLAVTHKDEGAGPVTEVDLAIDRMLAESLLGARPGYGWLSEESADDGTRLGAERVFVVDPIDGTRAFIAGEPGFAVSVAVVDRGRVVSAAVHLPARGETYSAATGQGARRDGRPIAVSDAQTVDGATVLAARAQMEQRHWPGGAPPLKRHFRSSLAWRMCLVAEGRFDSMLTFRRAYEWDIAAGTLIAEEAGARVTDGTGAAMGFNSLGGTQAGVVAAPEALHRRIMRHRLGKTATRGV